LAESFKTEEIAKEAAEEVKSEESPALEAKTETTESQEKEKSCPKCGALFPGTANFCGKCGTELGKTEIEKVEPKVEKVSETQQPEATKSENLENGQLFDCLSELDIGMEAINMEDTEAAIEKIDSALSDLDLFSKENNQAILNNKELKDITNTVGQMLEIAKGMVMKNEAVYIELSDIALEASEIGQSEITASEKNNSLHNLSTKLETVRTKMKGSGNKKLSDWFVGVENKVNGEIRRNQEAELTRLRESQVKKSSDLKIKTKKNESEKPSVGREVEDESSVEYYQGIYDETSDKIKTIISSNKNSYEKIDDLNREKEALKGSNDNFIPDDILEDEGVKEMIQDLKKEFDIARAKIEESKTEEEKKADAKKVVDFAVNNANKSLDFLKKSEETPSGKMSSLKGAMSLLESSTEKYKDIINSDKELNGKLNSTRSEINYTLKEQKKLQAENDKLAAKL